MNSLYEIGIFVLIFNGLILCILIVLYFKIGRHPDKKTIFEENVEYLFENNLSPDQWVLSETTWVDRRKSDQ